jgi:leucyl/phenylalanyl-tRNA--protein transferase
MADPGDGTIGWYSPDPRTVIPLDGLRVSRSLGRTVGRGTFAITTDLDFPAVIEACAGREETWISRGIVDSYTRLWTEGHAHSVECRAGGVLAGGLYGVAIGGAFFGESMFHRVTDASKAALAGLVAHLRARGFHLLDIQWVTEHLEQFGAVEIPRRSYLRLLEEALALSVEFA